MPQVIFMRGDNGEDDVLVGLPDSYDLVEDYVHLPATSIKYLGGPFMSISGKILHGCDDEMPAPGVRGRMFVVTSGEKKGYVFFDLGTEQVQTDIYALSQLLYKSGGDTTIVDNTTIITYDLTVIDCGFF